ncbi:MAG: acyclic terpene utilization AtuA family protein [Pseudomonadota bacterium]
MSKLKSRRTKALRIGCATGFWGDSEGGATQLVMHGGIDYLVFDFLAEITMSLLARARAKSPDAGYAPDFVRIVASLAGEIKSRGIKVVSNGGGVNPRACGEALSKQLQELGIDLKVAVVEGDDLSASADEFSAADVREMFSGAAMPAKCLSINAYLGAQPIAAALDAGADIVITGRVVDSAVTLGPLVHEFGWSWTDWDKLATGSLAGHVIECGTQATGGLFTDWERVPGWDDMGFPIAECEASGRGFVLTKPANTGGLVIPASVAEQVIYEIGDPAAYLLPDVTCDFRNVKLQQDGVERVRVSGARGTPAPASYKVSATYGEGWRLFTTLMIGGTDAAQKAQRVGEAILQRTRRMFGERGWGDYTETSLEVLGAESTYGPHARTAATREVILKIAAKHPSRDALELLAREIAPSATAMAQGITGFAAGRPSPSPVVRLFSFLTDRTQVKASVSMDGLALPFEETFEPATAVTAAASVASAPSAETAGSTDSVTVPLLRVAHGRSGDKGDMANIGIIARSDALYAVLQQELTADAVRDYMAHVAKGKVRRYSLPGFNALNFTLDNALGGGGVASLRYDPQGKALAQMLLDIPVNVPAAFLENLP